MYSLEDIRDQLSRVKANHAIYHQLDISAALLAYKKEAVQTGDETLAKEIWCLEQVFDIQNGFIRAFQNLQAGSYYEAWRTLEQVEIALGFLSRHFRSQLSRYKLDHIEEYVNKWQGLYPYNLFMSPEILEHEKICNICEQPISIRRTCGHRAGEIYQGEMCYRIVTEAELMGMSLVTDPVQKYSVLFMVDPETDQQRDHYNYALVEYALQGVTALFDKWEYVMTKERHPHSRYANIGRNELCPCESGEKYKKCCLNETGVLRPHCKFSFEVPPPGDLSAVEYID